MTRCMDRSLGGRYLRMWPRLWLAAGDAPSGAGSPRNSPALPGWCWGTAISAASAGVIPGYRSLIRPTARTPPRICAAMKLGADDGAMPAKVAENIRPMVIAGLAKLVDEVKK